MRIPDTLLSLADYGIIDEVLRPLMSGKEAQIYLVTSQGQLRVAKVYKEAQNRTFKNRAEYTEGRTVRNSRDQRAMNKGSRHGRAQAEAAWRTTEVDMIYRLRAADVRVPTPYHFIDGVLVMELITDEHGEPAPRLGDVVLDREQAQHVYDSMLAEVVRMLAAGVVHGDLSDFNILMGPEGPVVIDFPQAVDASSNQNARKLLLRDVDNLHRFMQRFAPERSALPYAQEMWALYERGELTPDTKLSGRYKPAERKVSTDSVLGLISDAVRDERRRRGQLGLSMKGAGELEEGESSAPESSAKPLSRYQQKRQAQVAATLAQKAAAASAPPAREQRGGGAHEQQTRGRHGHNEGRARGAHGAAQSRSHESRSQGSHAQQQRGQHGKSEARGHESRSHGAHAQQQRTRHGHSEARPHESRAHGSHPQEQRAKHGQPEARSHESRAQGSHPQEERTRHGQREGRPHVSHEQPRTKPPHTAPAARPHPAREGQSRAHESHSHETRSHAAHTQQQRPRHGDSDARPQVSYEQRRTKQAHTTSAARPHSTREGQSRDAGQQRPSAEHARERVKPQSEPAARHGSSSQGGHTKPRPRSAG